MGEQTPTKEPSQPVTIQLGARSIALDTAPVSGSEASKARGSHNWASFRDTVLVQPDPSRLVVRPRGIARLIRLFFYSFCAVGLFLVAIAPLFLPFIFQALPMPGWAVWLLQLVFDLLVPTGILVLAGVVFLVMFPLMAWGDRVVFDLSERRMTYGWFFSRKSRPVKEVLAIQVIPGEVHRVPEKESGGCQTWQLNLILDDPQCPRFNLSDHGNLIWTRQAGRQLAEFLHLPLLDQVPEGAERAAAALLLPPPAVVVVGWVMIIWGVLFACFGIAAGLQDQQQWLPGLMFGGPGLVFAGIGVVLLRYRARLLRLASPASSR
jgi:hypothetical protein